MGYGLQSSGIDSDILMCFGIDPDGAIKTLKSILEVYKYCNETFGMDSKTMEEIHNDLV